jgi:hypothetical protein
VTPRKLLLCLSGLLAAVACRPGSFDALTNGATARDAGVRDAAAAEAGPGDGAAPVEDAGLPDGGTDGCERAPDLPLVLGNADLAQIATLVDPPAVAMRIPGPSAWLGEHHVYTFGATRPQPGDAGPSPIYASAALAGANPPWLAPPDADTTWSLEETLDAEGLPRELLPPRAGEEGRAFRPASLIRTTPGQLGGTLFVLEASILTNLQVWLARLDDGATVAERAEAPLFAVGERLFALGAHRGRDFVKVYACERDPDVDDYTDLHYTRCFVARAPVGELDRRASYSAYREGAWHEDLATASAVLYGPADTLSVSWNGYLKAFVAVHGKTLHNKVVVQTAARSEGPWEPVAELDLPPAPYGASGVTLHAGGSCDDRLVVSYLAPTRLVDGIFPVEGKVVFVSIDLR